eukprot:GHVT01048406.1.p1 GENE.GHVT01048406.1~~GHVT01048406.1.p1  ORF type:complete len:656 (+),score=171.91 GHVT01048406.1:639-2606(+)
MEDFPGESKPLARSRDPIQSASGSSLPTDQPTAAGDGTPPSRFGCYGTRRIPLQFTAATAQPLNSSSSSCSSSPHSLGLKKPSSFWARVAAALPFGRPAVEEAATFFGEPRRLHAADAAGRQLAPAQPCKAPEQRPRNWWPDRWNIALLLLLYTVQGIPMGLSGSVPFLLQGKITYKDQSLYSLVSLPFSLKLLWAPVVDAVYWKPMGRRRSWLVPVQFGCALLMLWGAQGDRVGRWLGVAGGDARPNIEALAVYFATLFFLMATQDIAVDAWALTILSRSNRTYASTCNTVGQTVGFFVAHVGFLALSDVETCNNYFRRTALPSPIVTLSSFLSTWGWVIIFLTVVTLVFKQERDDDDRDEDEGMMDEWTSRGSLTPPRAAPSVSDTPKLLFVSSGGAATASPRVASSPSTARQRRHIEANVCMEPMFPQELHLFTDSLCLAEEEAEAVGSPADDRRGAAVAGASPSAEGPSIVPLTQANVRKVSEEEGSREPRGILESYAVLYQLLRLPAVQLLTVVLLTCRMAFAATDAVTHLKILERGMTKEQLAVLGPLLIPLGIVCPMIVNTHAGKLPPALFHQHPLLCRPEPLHHLRHHRVVCFFAFFAFFALDWALLRRPTRSANVRVGHETKTCGVYRLDRLALPPYSAALSFLPP